MLSRKRPFEGPEPANYVAGLGRGYVSFQLTTSGCQFNANYFIFSATGFTTRSDIGPAREQTYVSLRSNNNSSNNSEKYLKNNNNSALTHIALNRCNNNNIISRNFGKAPENYVAGRGRGATGFGFSQNVVKKDDDEDEGGGGPDGDALGDNEEGLFDYANYDAEDAEADAIWDWVDQRMDSRRKRQREAREKEEQEKARKQRPKIHTHFADVKEELKDVSWDEWANLPEAGDRSSRHKRQKTEGRFTPVPDSLLEQARLESQTVTQIDPRRNYGLETPGTMSSVSGTASTFTPIHDLRKIGEAKKTVLDTHLRATSDSVTGQTTVDTKGYLTDLSHIRTSTDAEVGDRKKAELLMENITTTNPSHAPGWIARARLLESAGKLAQARKVIADGCKYCPRSAEVWLEAARLNPDPTVAKALLAQAVSHLPESVPLWTAAANLETDRQRKRRVYRKALEHIPNSPMLWRAAVELEEPDDARVMLKRAVECVPHNTEMWLALAKLETYENAKKVLNKARETIPTDKAIWITAAQLEEAHGNESAVRKVIKKSVKSLADGGVKIDRDEWLKEAQQSESAGYAVTCQSIVMETIGIGIEEEDRKSVWCEDADNCIASGFIQTARAIYAQATTTYPSKKSFWMRMADLERNHGTKESLEQVLKQAVQHCSQNEVLWLMAAKEKWLQGNIQDARRILEDASGAIKGSEQIYLAAVKLEKENDEFERARSLLQKARKNASTARVWMKSAQLEREIGNAERERELLDEALQQFNKFDKLWMMRGQHHERAGRADEARTTYQQGLAQCKSSIALWLCLSRLEEKQPGGASKARAVLEKARLTNPKHQELWLESIHVENRAGNKKMAMTLLAKALQECSTSGKLWALAIDLENTPQKKARSVDALARCGHDPFVLVALGKLFWGQRKIEKARTWFNRSVTEPNGNPDIGDSWAWFYKFELQHGTEEHREALVKRVIVADPHHGDYWVQVSKRDENARLKPDQILKKVVLLLPNVQ
jgi:pre-mRNA-processing factor 6